MASPPAIPATFSPSAFPTARNSGGSPSTIPKALPPSTNRATSTSAAASTAPPSSPCAAIPTTHTQGPGHLPHRLLWKTPTDFPVMLGPITLIDDLVLCRLRQRRRVVHSAQNPQGLVIALDRKTGAVHAGKTNFDDSVLGAVAARDGIGSSAPCRSGARHRPLRRQGWQRRLAPPHQRHIPRPRRLRFTDTNASLRRQQRWLPRHPRPPPKTATVLEKIYLNDPAKPGARPLQLSSPKSPAAASHRRHRNRRPPLLQQVHRGSRATNVSRATWHTLLTHAAQAAAPPTQKRKREHLA